MTEFGELGLEQRVIARVVHETKMILEFGVEADGQDVFLKRNRICVHEITARERADAANGFNQFCPQPGQVGGNRSGFGQCCGRGDRRRVRPPAGWPARLVLVGVRAWPEADASAE